MVTMVRSAGPDVVYFDDDVIGRQYGRLMEMMLVQRTQLAVGNCDD